METQAVRIENQSETAFDSVIVRVGDRQWVIGQSADSTSNDTDQPSFTEHVLRKDKLPNASVAAAVHVKVRFNPWHQMRTLLLNDVRTLRGTFQMGLIVGMVFGCLSLMMFHVLEPRYSQGIQSFQRTSIMTVQPGAGLPIPAMDVSVLQIGPFSSLSKALIVKRELAKMGLPTGVHLGKLYSLWSKPSLHATVLFALQNHLSKLKYHTSIQTVRWATSAIVVPYGTNVSNLRIVSKWLDAEVTALNTLIGTESDGGLAKDALIAYQTAQREYPSASVLASTGYERELASFEAFVADAFSSFEQHRMQATDDVIQAVQTLDKMQNFRGQTG